MSNLEKVTDPFDVAESNKSYSEAKEEKEMEADLPILIEDSDEEGEAMELGEIKDDVKLLQEVPQELSSPGSPLTVTLPRSAVDLAKKLSTLSEASLQRIGDFLPFLESEKNAQIGRDGLKAELDCLQKESQQYAEHISSQKRILHKYVLEEKEISEKWENLEECGEVMAELHEQEESQMLQVEASIMRRLMERHSGVFQSALRHCYHPFRGSLFEPEDPISYKRNVFKHFGLDIQKLDKDSKHFLQALCGYFDELSCAFDAPVLALGASAPPALAQGSNTYLTEKMDLDLQGVPLIPLRNNGVPILSQRGRESAGHAFEMALYNGLKTKIGKRQGAPGGKGWWAVPTPVRHLAAFDRDPPALPHHHSTDHGPKECFGNGPFHINPAVIGSEGDPFRQMDKILSQKMFLEVFSVDSLCLGPKRAVSGRFVVGSSVQIGNSSQRKFIISKVGDKAWVVGEGGLEFADMASLSRYV
ncbi:unnamed protein product [Notodromas monacha]|uniref:Uncharacterized protein n=1 Tax=Notodromas monacha TaxID=399045 RepID=A0A7R9C0E3_9CRUS|nr:unnamed protein product [Notodromas monacha]CAG0924005.1 unnamed protein product [Notodromas monacha]